MSDGSLSQDEIDALLQGTESLEMDTGSESAALSPQEINAFKNILGEIIDSQSSNLSMLIGKTVKIGMPTLEVKNQNQLNSSISDEMVEIKINLTDGISGQHSYLLDVDGVKRIVSPMLGQDNIDLNEMAFSTIGEAISNITGPVTTVLGNKLGKTIQTSPPEANLVVKANISLPGEQFLCLDYPVTIEGDMPTNLIEIYSLQTVKEIAASVGGGSPVADNADLAMNNTVSNVMNNTQPSNTGLQQTFGQPIGNMGMGFIDQANSPNVQPIQFANLQPTNVSGEQGNIGLLMDVFMEMTVELGRTKKLIKDILTIGEGTIIELDKLAGEPVDILVNHKLIAKGEVVVIDENFGVRVTEIVSPLERMGDLT